MKKNSSLIRPIRGCSAFEFFFQNHVHQFPKLHFFQILAFTLHIFVLIFLNITFSVYLLLHYIAISGIWSYAIFPANYFFSVTEEIRIFEPGTVLLKNRNNLQFWKVSHCLPRRLKSLISAFQITLVQKNFKNSRPKKKSWNQINQEFFYNQNPFFAILKMAKNQFLN